MQRLTCYEGIKIDAFVISSQGVILRSGATKNLDLTLKALKP